MTVNNSNITSGPYIGNDVATEFDYTFRVDDESDLIVFETDDSGVEFTLTVNVDYTINDIGVDGGGTVLRLAGALPTGYTWYMRSSRESTQLTSFSSQGAFFPEIHEEAFDKLTYLVLQSMDNIERSLHVSESYSDIIDTELPTPIAGRSLKWNPTATAIINSDYDVDTVGALTEEAQGWVEDTEASAIAAAASADAAALSATDAENAADTIVGFENTGAWQTATTYIVNNQAQDDGSTYICIVDHISTVFNTDLGNGKWEVYASKGNPGLGTGDMLGVNNLNDVNDKAASLAILGGLPLAGGTLSGPINQKSFSVAAHATTTDIWSGGNVAKLTGSIVTFTDVVDAPLIGAWRWVISNDAHVLKNNSNIAVQGGADYTLTSGQLTLWYSSTLTTFEVFIPGYVNPDASSLVGEIFDWPLNTTPTNGLFCNGAAVSRTTYIDLFNVVGTFFGAGDGVTTFNLPNIPQYYATTQGNGSNDSGNITTGQNKSHTHGVDGYDGSGIFVQVERLLGASRTTGVKLATDSTASSGGARNIAAAMFVRKCIRFC